MKLLWLNQRLDVYQIITGCMFVLSFLCVLMICILYPSQHECIHVILFTACIFFLTEWSSVHGVSSSSKPTAALPPPPLPQAFATEGEAKLEQPIPLQSAPQFEHKDNDLLFVISDSVVHPIVHAQVCTLMCIRTTSLNCC